jgi:hypothetical protein
MSRTLIDAQPTIAPLIGALTTLLQGHPVDVGDLLPVVRAARTTAYAGAGADTVDAVALVDVLRRHPSLLTAADGDLVIAVDDAGVVAGLDPRGVPAGHRAARALMDACVVSLEAKKLAHGMTATPSSLKASFASPDEARTLLTAVAGLASSSVLVQPSASLSSLLSLSSSSLAASLSAWTLGRVPSDRPLHLVVGGGARRLLDVLAPSVRRLRVELALVGRRGAIVDDEDVYRGLRRLHAANANTVTERRAKDADEGLGEHDSGAAFVVDALRLSEDTVDRRARSLVQPLKRARAIIVGVVDAAELEALLGALVEDGRGIQSVQVLAPTVVGEPVAIAIDDGDGGDDVVVDAATGHVWLAGTATPAMTTLSLPWLGLLPADVGGDDGAFAALQAVARARLMDGRIPSGRLRRVIDDDSTAALAALASMVAV